MEKLKVQKWRIEMQRRTVKEYVINDKSSCNWENEQRKTPREN